MNSPLPGSFSSLFAQYRAPEGIFDEATSGGQLRDGWRGFVQQLDRTGVMDLQRRWEQAQRQMLNDGVTFHPQDLAGNATRPWSLDGMPLLLAEQEWNPLAEGLAQRARLYEVILQDLFGPQQLLRDRMVPPAAVFGHPSYCPAYHGLIPQDGAYLQLFASDLSRAVDGRWLVSGDRTRAPFGLGYLLENRIVASRNLPLPFRHCRVKRLAPFFIALQDTLRGMATRFRDNPRIALWTKGPTSPAYFEDAYLARYLGYTLVEGDDLAVRDNRVTLKTLGGLLPVEVLFRRLDDDDCDPVELAPDSRVGISGLIEVARSGNVAVANGLGSRLVESPIFLPYLKEICEKRLGESLRIPNVQTWWCGNPDSLTYVLEHLDELLVRPAYRSIDQPAVHPRQMSTAKRSELIAQIRAQPEHFVAQEMFSRSTTPVWTEGGLKPWYLTVRGFAVANGDDFLPLPGGLSRVSPDAMALDQTMTSGERSQDVWILSDRPVEEVSLLPSASKQVTLRRSGDDFPSRVADNLFWLGRNLERAEAQARLLRTTLLRLNDEREHVPEKPMLLRALAERGQIEPDYVIEGLRQRLPAVGDMLPESVFDGRQPLSLRATILEAVRIASALRDRVAVDMWRIIRRIDETSRRPQQRRSVEPAEALQVLDQLITELVALAGLAAESMTRTQAWRFLDMGRRLERAWQTAVLARATLAEKHAEENNLLEAVLVTVDSIMTYRSRYLASLQPAPVVDLLLTDETNPRSIASQLAVLMDHVDRLPRNSSEAQRTTEQRIALTLLNAVRLADVHDLVRTDAGNTRPGMVRLLGKLYENLPRFSDAISGRFLIHAGLQRHFAGGQHDPE